MFYSFSMVNILEKSTSSQSLHASNTSARRLEIDEFKVPDKETLMDRFARECTTINAASIYKEYCRFIELKISMGDYDDLILSPSPFVDSMWHIHILDTRRYSDMCSKLPSFIHHNPDGGKDPEARRKRYENTLLTYRARFGEDATSTVWPNEKYVDDDKLMLIVEACDGKKITVATELCWSIEKVKSAIQESEGIPIDNQRLMFGGEHLPNNYMLRECGVKNGLKFHLHQSFEVFVKTLTGKTIIIVADPSWTINQFKSVIRGKEGVPLEQLRLIFAGKYMKDKLTLKDYNVHNNSTIHIKSPFL